MLNSSINASKHFGIISILFMGVSIFLLCYFYNKKEGKVLTSISETVAANKKISLIFSIILAIGLPVYYLGILLYIFPKYNMPFFCSLLLIIAFISEMQLIWFPSKGKTIKIHSLFGLIASLIMFLLMVLILTIGQNILYTTQIIAAILFISSIISFILYKIWKKKNRKYTFILEIAFISLYILSFLLLNYF